MDNSFSLGVLHGLFYAITPSLPFLMVVKYYLMQGPKRSALVYGGVLLGQFIFLWMSFFGWKELIWFWFYLEPILMVLGWCAIGGSAIELAGTRVWGGLPRNQNIFDISRREGFTYVGAGVLWVFANPGTFGGTTLLGSPPTNSIAYLFGFLLLTGVFMFGAWFKTFRPTGAASINSLMQESQTRLLRKVKALLIPLLWIWVLMTQVTIGDESHLMYHYDNLIGYTPFEQLTYSYSRDLVWQKDEEVVDDNKPEDVDYIVPIDTGDWDWEKGEYIKKPDEDAVDPLAAQTGEEAEDPLLAAMARDEDEEDEEDGDEEGEEAVLAAAPKEELTEDFLQSNFDYNEGSPEERSPVPAKEYAPWHAALAYDEFNERIERSPDKYEQSLERGPYEYSEHYNERVMKHRFRALRLFLLPEWDKEQEPHFAQRLAAMRLEMDSHLMEQTIQEQRMVFPDHLIEEGDVNFGSVPEKAKQLDYNRLGAYRRKGGDITRGTYNQLHHGNRGGLEENTSLVKLQPIPNEVRFPWDFPLVEKVKLPIVSVSELMERRDVNPEHWLNEIAAIEEVNAGIDKHYIHFLDPVALNTRIRTNDPDDFAIPVELASPDKYDDRVRDGFRRYWQWKMFRKAEPGWEDEDGNRLVPPATNAELYPWKKVPTTPRTK